MLRLPFHHCNHQFVFYTCDSVSLLCAFFWFYFRFHISVITQSIWLSEISYLTYFTKSNTPRYSLGSFTLLQKAEFHSFLWLNNMRCDSWGRKESDMTEWLNWTELNWISHLYPFILWWILVFTSFIKINLFFNWRIIALQIFVVFCKTSTCICHRYTYIHSFFFFIFYFFKF